MLSLTLLPPKPRASMRPVPCGFFQTVQPRSRSLGNARNRKGPKTTCFGLVLFSPHCSVLLPGRHGATSHEAGIYDRGAGDIAGALSHDGPGTRRRCRARRIIRCHRVGTGRRRRWCARRIYGRTIDCAFVGSAAIRQPAPRAEAGAAGNPGVACRQPACGGKSGYPAGCNTGTAAFKSGVDPSTGANLGVAENQFRATP